MICQCCVCSLLHEYSRVENGPALNSKFGCIVYRNRIRYHFQGDLFESFLGDNKIKSRRYFSMALRVPLLSFRPSRLPSSISIFHVSHTQPTRIGQRVPSSKHLKSEMAFFFLPLSNCSAPVNEFSTIQMPVRKRQKQVKNYLSAHEKTGICAFEGGKCTRRHESQYVFVYGPDGGGGDGDIFCEYKKSLSSIYTAFCSLLSSFARDIGERYHAQ